MKKLMSECSNTCERNTVLLFVEERMLGLLQLHERDRADLARDHVCLQVKGVWIASQTGTQPAEVPVTAAGRIRPPGGHVKEAVLAQ